MQTNIVTVLKCFFFSFFLFFFSKQNVIYFNILYICNNKSMNIINIETVAESDIKMPSIDKTLGWAMV